jgi:hypothetical protein
MKLAKSQRSRPWFLLTSFNAHAHDHNDARKTNIPPKTWHQSGYRIVRLEGEQFLSS